MLALQPGSFEVSGLLSEEGNWLFVCLFRRWQFPPWSENCIHLSLFLVLRWTVTKLCRGARSVRGLNVLWSSGLTPLHLSAAWAVWSFQSDSNFHPIRFFFQKRNILDTLFLEWVVCQTPYGVYTYKVIHMGHRLDVLLPVYRQDRSFFLWGFLLLMWEGLFSHMVENVV